MNVNITESGDIANWEYYKERLIEERDHSNMACHPLRPTAEPQSLQLFNGNDENIECESTNANHQVLQGLQDDASSITMASINGSHNQDLQGMSLDIDLKDHRNDHIYADQFHNQSIITHGECDYLNYNQTDQEDSFVASVDIKDEIDSHSDDRISSDVIVDKSQLMCSIAITGNAVNEFSQNTNEEHCELGTVEDHMGYTRNNLYGDDQRITPMDMAPSGNENMGIMKQDENSAYSSDMSACVNMTQFDLKATSSYGTHEHRTEWSQSSTMGFLSEESNTQPESEVSQDSFSDPYAGLPRPRMNLNFSHLLRAATASSLTGDRSDSPMSINAYEICDNNSQSLDGSPEFALSGDGLKPKSGPRRKKIWLIDDDQEGKEPLTDELRNGLRILKEVMSDTQKSLNWPFMNPVDSSTDGCHDYYERISHPMCLREMREKFDDRKYKTITEFVADFRVMLENCYRYNGPDHLISRRGQRLETVLEQKLALLSRELREKTSIEATSGKPSPSNKSFLVPGARRRKALIPHDSTALLSQLRMEQQEKVKEHRKQQAQGRKQALEQFVKELDDWEDTLFGTSETKKELNAMWEIPQIGHFLYLCLCSYDLGEIMHYELEHAFLMPRESTTMRRVMTSLLSTPYQRTRLEKKPPMPYKVWEEKLRKKLNLWYQTLRGSHGDFVKACQKIGLDENFFKVMGMSNPLSRKKYHELTLYQRVWIVKGLCDACLEQQESIREAIEAVQPVEDQNTYCCGTDGEGNTYLHFPQFCGADVRIYRQAPIKYPKLDIPKPEPVKSKQTSRSKAKMYPPKKKKKLIEDILSTPSSSPSRPRDGRLRQNPRLVAAKEVNSSAASTDLETEQDSDPSDDSAASSAESDAKSSCKSTTIKSAGWRNQYISSRESTPSSTRKFRGRGRGRNFSRETTPTSSLSRSSTPTKTKRLPGLRNRENQSQALSGTPTTSCTEVNHSNELKDNLPKGIGHSKVMLNFEEETGSTVDDAGDKDDNNSVKEMEVEEDDNFVKNQMDSNVKKEAQTTDKVRGIKAPFTSYEKTKGMCENSNSEKLLSSESCSEGATRSNAMPVDKKPECNSNTSTYSSVQSLQVKIEENPENSVQIKDLASVKSELNSSNQNPMDEELMNNEVSKPSEHDSEDTKPQCDENLIAQSRIEGENSLVDHEEKSIKQELDRHGSSKENGTDNVSANIRADATDEEEELQPEILGPDLKAFELVVDSVEALRQLARQFEEPEPCVIGHGKKKKVPTATLR